jgi:hypothetical protein
MSALCNERWIVLTMTRRLAIATLLTVTAAVGAAAQRQQPARLIVVNYTGAVITISAIVNGTAQGRARVTPGASLPIVPVSNGDRFQASPGGQSPDHVVRLTYDQAYGGLQDTWTVK